MRIAHERAGSRRDANRREALLGLAGAFGLGASSAESAVPAARPFWASRQVVGDPMLFVQDPGGAPAGASLLFTPARAPALSSTLGDKTFELGRDFLWVRGSRTIELTPDSRIPVATAEELFPPLSVPPGTNLSRSHPERGLLIKEAFFQARQVIATYRRAERWDGFTPQPSRLLPRTRRLLRRHAPLRLTVLGDSISTGASATSDDRKYPSLLVEGLRSLGASDVLSTNLSVGGMVSAWGVRQVEKVVASKPDLVVVAFGMNDAAIAEPAAYGANIRRIVHETRAAIPACEVILVSSMLPNADWARLKPAFPAFQAELRALVGPGVALADVTSLWDGLLMRKRFYDLTANGVNHPNDFGQRTYAETILELLR